MKYTFPITAIHCGGETRLLYSGQEVRDFVSSTQLHRWGGFPVGAEWTSYPTPYYDPIKNEWILRDDRGFPVDWTVFHLPHPNWKNRKGDFEYRNGPVPGRCGYRGCTKFDAPRKRHGGRGMILRDAVHRAEFQNRSLKKLKYLG